LDRNGRQERETIRLTVTAVDLIDDARDFSTIVHRSQSRCIMRKGPTGEREKGRTITSLVSLVSLVF
jgi:hypothetical protein